MYRYVCWMHLYLYVENVNGNVASMPFNLSPNLGERATGAFHGMWASSNSC